MKNLFLPIIILYFTVIKMKKVTPKTKTTNIAPQNKTLTQLGKTRHTI